MKWRTKKDTTSAKINNHESGPNFLNEIETIEDKEHLSTEQLKNYAKLAEENKKLKKQIKKITRIGDITQKKLLRANEEIEKKNIELNKKEETLQAELSRAAEYITSIIPPPITSGSILTEWQFFPSIKLGGDSFGYHWIDKENFAIYLLDVSNHGIGPALLSVSVLNLIRTESLPDTDFRCPELVLKELNKRFQMKNHNKLYFSIWYGVFKKTKNLLTYASAGHPPALLITHSNEIRELRTPFLFIGGRPVIDYKSTSIEISTPASLYVFSDGVYEVTKPNSTLWSLEELKEFLINPPDKNLAEIDQLYPYLQKVHHSPLLDDDFAILKVHFST
jgi:sigma-B regulation protein RsbU (phosphoserine phosphatase)